jgi:Zn finger protein HypA/HybF involved in hydrogenase expression
MRLETRHGPFYATCKVCFEKPPSWFVDENTVKAVDGMAFCPECGYGVQNDLADAYCSRCDRRIDVL